LRFTNSLIISHCLELMRRPLVEVEKAKYLDCVSESAAAQDLKAPGERRE